jgi:cyanate permease
MTSKTNNKWFILFLIGLTAALVMAMPGMAIPVLFSEISDDLGLTLVQIGAVWGTSSLAGVLTALLGGMISDRIGTRLTLAFGCLAIGVTGAMRGLSNSFASLAGFMLLSGLIGSVIPVNLHKACGIWFSGKNLGLANGFVSAGMAIGFMSGSMMSASILSPWLGGWRQVLFFYGGVAVVMSIPWLLSKSAPGDGGHTEIDNGTESIRRSLSRVIRLRNIWLLGFFLLGVSGAIQGLLGYLPLYLREIGWASVRADGALATFHAISLASVFPVAFLSDRLKTRKKILMAASIMTVLGIGMLPFVEGPIIWVAVVIAGAMRDGFMAIFFTWVREQKGVLAANSGIAIGLSLMLGRSGGLIAPPLGNSLGVYNLRYPFILWAVMALIGMVVLLFIKEDKVTPGEVNPTTLH